MMTIDFMRTSFLNNAEPLRERRRDDSTCPRWQWHIRHWCWL